MHSIRSHETWLYRSGERPAAAELDRDIAIDADDLERLAEQLEPQVAHLVEREGLTSLHAMDLGLAGRVVQRVQASTGTPYCVTPCRRDALARDPRAIARGRGILAGARHVVLLADNLRATVESTFAPRPGEPPLRLRLARRGVDLRRFKPIERRARARAAATLVAPPELANRVRDIDWERACVVLCLQLTNDPTGFASFLFALPEVLRQQPALQVVVVPCGPEPATVDALRAALAAGRPELLEEVLQTSELYQPLLDHLGRLHAEGRAHSWWNTASRLEPERRVRYTGAVSRDTFAALLALADVFVIPGHTSRAASHALYEALACGVLALAGEAAIAPLMRLVADEISGEIASLCVLRADAPAVHELEEKLGRVVRLRPELSDRLRELAIRKFDGRQVAADLRRLYGESARVPALRT